MHIHIKTVQTGWILQKIAERIAASNPEVFTVSSDSDPDADANYYVDVGNCFQPEDYNIPSKKIGLFTHLHKHSMRWMPPQCLKLDHIVHMTQRYYDRFTAHGFEKDKMSVLYPYEISEGFNLKKPVIGIFQRGEHEGKGFHFMREFVKRDVCEKFQWLFVGSGWDEIKNILRIKDNLVNEDLEYHGEYTHGNDVRYNHYPKLYNLIDYLLVPSLWEGGPVGFAESLSMGIPTIASDVGWCGYDFKTDYRYDIGDSNSLESVLETIIEPLEDRRKQVEHLNYKTYGEKLIKITNSLL
tara:strand:- start:29976 stop:30866 length:891 start_codon:yes stop_codon:yes gene_type:complete